MQAPPRRRRVEIADNLRRRIVSAISGGALRRGDRLPSAREVAAEFDADPRLVLASYRILANEGLVAIRRRSGIYVAAASVVAGGPAVVADGWLVDVLTQGLEHGIAAPRLGDWLRRCTTTRRLRAAVVANSDDQLESFVAELRDDYGIDAVPYAPEAIARPGGPPPEMLAADFVAACDPILPEVRRAFAPSRTRVVAIELRSEIDTAWRRSFQQGAIYFVVADARSSAPIRDLAGEYAERVRVLIAGQDDLTEIAPTASVYVSRAVRRRFATLDIPGRALPPARVFATRTMRELLAVVVEANLNALRG